MKQSKLDELERLKYFMLKPFPANIQITDEDIKKFFEWSEDGRHKKDVRQSHFTDGFNALVSAKQWQGRAIHELYEPGILDGSVAYFTLLGGYDADRKPVWFWKFLSRFGVNRFKHDPVPRVVVDFLKKEMFKGVDAENIEEVYQELLKS